MGLLQQASLVITPNAVKAGKLYAIKPTDGSGDLDVVRATTATRVNSTGLIESVGNNISRLDYTNASCPSILVEPQRTNLHLNSQQMWNMISFGGTLPSKAQASINSPQGINNAVIVTGGNGSSGVWGIFQTIGTIIPSGSQIAVSVFAKAGTHGIINLSQANISFTGGAGYASFNLSNGTTPTPGARIEDYGNGWYRCHLPIITLTANTNTGYNIGHYIAPSTTTNIWTTDFNGKSVYFYGIQVEVGSNSTSYIPTTTSSVTRNADVISKSGVSSLIGQTEGTIYVDFFLKTNNAGLITAIDIETGVSNFIAISINSNRVVRLEVRSNSGSVITLISTPILQLGNNKIVILYKSGNYKMFLNGTNIGNSNNSIFPNGVLKQFCLSNASYGYFNNFYNTVALWKTQLTDAQAIQLTTL